ncbi:MAG: hypothetical protein IT429_09605 [Gemmataceae bacterium]|nr:hypothetical protein [Gemmataceae bacterium]
MNFKKQMTGQDLLTSLQQGQIFFPPFKIEVVQINPPVLAQGDRVELDAVLALRWCGQLYRFGVEARRLWTPKVIAEAVEAARRSASAAGLNPLVLTPYLSEERVLALEAEGVSGIDLCGNGVVVVPGKLLVLRTGAPNRYRWEGTIKNVYRKNSSIVARVFLLVPSFNSIKATLEEIRRRGGDVTTATVSKVCKSLENDLVIERERGEAPVARRRRLLQPDKLLDLLAQNYVAPDVGRSFQGKCTLAPEALAGRLAAWEKKPGRKVAQTGASSVGAYAVMAREPVRSFYCSDLKSILQALGDDVRETERFANVAFQETRDDFVYFDRRPGLVASPLQTYLELVRGDQREKDTADQVRRVILGQQAQTSRGKE